MKKLTVGVMAHVDAGKTTLIEAMLYSSGMTRALGRVDKRTSFLDTNSIERERGITVFSKLAEMKLDELDVTVVDTPGHVDFLREAERALSVQDLCVLVISAEDGIQAHTVTLWNLLKQKGVPTFIFVNKTDLYRGRRIDILSNLRATLSNRIVSFTDTESSDFYEAIASLDEGLMEEYFATDTLTSDSIKDAVSRRRIFPCFFGSALKNEGVRELLRGIESHSPENEFSESILGIKVYKIARDKEGKRIAFAKVTGGSVKLKDTLVYKDKNGNIAEEKIEGIRIFSGDSSRPTNEAKAGGVYALYGLNSAYAGLGIGSAPSERDGGEAALDYRLSLGEGQDPYKTFLMLAPLSEEDPSLSIRYDERKREIRIGLMGEIQKEVLTKILAERFGIKASFDEGEILYKETVKTSVIGSGHFEPLRHYAEVHLLIEPLPEGSGVLADTECDRELLPFNWQRLVMTHIEERRHRGRLIGAMLTDVKITLIAGKAHAKHTEGGDFRQATYRAIRQGLMKAECVLLEPTYNFKIELPSASLGRLMNDITSMHGTIDTHTVNGELAEVSGNCPVSTMRSYAVTLRAYTSGKGKLTVVDGPYKEAYNQEQVINQRSYDPLSDERNPSSSVFCKAGAGYTVPWNEADEKMHIRLYNQTESEDEDAESKAPTDKRPQRTSAIDEDKELMRIFEATYGKITPRRVKEKQVNEARPQDKPQRPRPIKKGEEITVIDGYNLIFANPTLTRLAEAELAHARERLILLLSSYAAYKRINLLLVFDAYKRKDNKGSREIVGNLTVIYTKERQTADAFIEKTTYERAKIDTVRVVSSDKAEQFVILGNGALRVSPREFFEEMEKCEVEMNDLIEQYKLK